MIKDQVIQTIGNQMFKGGRQTNQFPKMLPKIRYKFKIQIQRNKNNNNSSSNNQEIKGQKGLLPL